MCNLAQIGIVWLLIVWANGANGNGDGSSKQHAQFLFSTLQKKFNIIYILYVYYIYILYT